MGTDRTYPGFLPDLRKIPRRDAGKSTTRRDGQSWARPLLPLCMLGSEDIAEQSRQQGQQQVEQDQLSGL